jgi:sigma-E factor negative regulatory protein RseC
MYALLGAGAGLALGLLWLRGHSARRNSGGYRPIVLRQSTSVADVRICKRGHE